MLRPWAVWICISQRKKHMQMIWHDYILINLNIEAMLEFLNLCFADTPKWAEQSPAPTHLQKRSRVFVARSFVKFL